MWHIVRSIHLTAISLGLSVSCAAAGISACNSQGTLSPSTSGVVSHDGTFSRSGGHEYPYRTLSIAEKENRNDPKNRNMCFRYQIDNTGKENIELFAWPDINYWGSSDIKPKQQPPETVLRNKPTDAENAAIKDDSIVQAFEKAEDKTRAYFTVEDKDRSRGPSSKLVFFSYQDPKVIAALESKGVRVNSIAAYSQPTVPEDFPPLRTSFESGGPIFEVISNARFTGDIFLVTTVVTTASSDATVYAPLLLATEKPSFVGPLDEKNVSDFLGILDGQRYASLKLAGRKYEHTLSFRPSTAKGAPTLFVSAYPLTIRGPTGSYCIGVNSYLPLPIDVGGEYCNWKVIRK